MQEEIWKVYKTFVCYNQSYRGKNVVEVSDQGNVRINGELVDLSQICQKKYLSIASTHIHRMVAELFVPNPENKPCVDHINCNKYDNRAVNLRWVTYKENSNNELTRKNISTSLIGKTKGRKREIGGMTGKNQSEEMKRRQSEYKKNWWKQRKGAI